MVTEHKVDWLVAGSGAAGMTGAVVANQLGGSVLVVEKEPVFGGTTAKSGGVAWIPGNHRQPEMGIHDSIEEGYSYLKGLIGDSVDQSRLKAYARRAPEMLRFMMQYSQVDYTPLSSYMDYYESVPGYKPGGRSMDPKPINIRRLGTQAKHLYRADIGGGRILPFNMSVREVVKLQKMDSESYFQGIRLLLRYWLDIPARLRGQEDDRLTLGPGLAARLRRSLMDRNIPLWLDSPMTKLIVEDGQVCGAWVSRAGKSVRVTVHNGVLLATGGFAQNAKLRNQHQGPPIGTDWTAAAPGATGDGIVMGQQVGADLAFMDCAWWSPTYTTPNGETLALIAGKSHPGSIMVNKLGKRFTNEAQPYEDLVKDQYASEARGEGAIPCYLVFDATFRRKYVVGHFKPARMEDDSKIPQANFDSGLFTLAPTLEELAEKLNIDGAQLQRTVETFNHHAIKGEDPQFNRGKTKHDRHYADPKVIPNPSLAPLDTGPFYALRCDPGDLDTKGGLQCDEHARVIDTRGGVIPGLYAAGNTSAAVMGNTYPGAGSTIGSAMTFAYIAAQHAFDH
ncbi:MAG: FAD-binding protein [Halieaceae bacterium]|jgi:3-oxosteroid 1-dehydrogenase|nr:FAD-binding protein [Halieaceae bacterium]